ncbi:MAG: hypothetical protein K8I27_00830 [Planctomycetes bacterium]|nr:hypothetical protein [Planctomycetota bacterium]
MKASTLLSCLVLIAIAGAFAACGGGGAPPGGGGGAPAPIAVSISPKATAIQLGTTRLFTATVSAGTVSWSIPTGGAAYGTIDAFGLYSAPAAMPGSPVMTIRASSASDPSVFDDATVTLTAAPVYGAFPVRFDVRSRNGWQSLLAPVTCGIPMPLGLHTDVNTLRVQRVAGGVNTDAQFRVTSRWPGGSIRWVMVDFLADTSAIGGVGQYQLNNGGTGNATGTGLSVVNGAANIVVSTGPLEFTVNKNSFNLLSSVKIDRDGTGPLDECLNTAAMQGVVMTEGADSFLTGTIAPSRVAIEENGPIRVTIVVEGVHRSGLGVNKLDYTVRLTAYAGLPFVHVTYSFINRTGDGVPAASASAAAAQLAQVEMVDSINLDLPIDFGASPPNARIGGNPFAHTATAMTAGQYIDLYHYYAGTHDALDPQNPQPPGFNVGTGDGSSEPLTDAWPDQTDVSIQYDVDTSGSVATTVAHAPGWIQMAGGGMHVTAALAEFWQHYPKQVRGQADGLMRIGIWPDAAAPLQVFAGAMKTHRMLLSFDQGGAITPLDADARYNFLNDPPRGVCNPKHYAASRAFGRIAWTNETLTDVNFFRAVSQPFAANYMREVVDHMGDLLGDRTNGNGGATGHEYGMWNFGDSKHDAPVAGWENNAWGISSAAFQWFAMSGNLELLYLADTTARHFRDVDVLHSDIGLRFDYTESGNPAVSGGKASQRGKTRYFPNNKQHDLGNYHLGAHHLDVFNGAFLAEHWLLTGDATSLDVLKEIYTYLRGTWKRFFDAGNGGTDSTMSAPTTWLSNALLIAAAYERANGSNDPTASAMTQYVLAAVRTRQTTVTPNDPNGRGFADSTGFFRAWEVGHLMEALEWTRTTRDDPLVDTYILDGMNWLLGLNAGVYLGHPPTNTFGAFAEVPGGGTDFGGPNLMIGAGYIGAFMESGDPNWITAADNLLDAQTPNILDTVIGDDAMRHSSFAQYFRAGPMLLATLD